MDMFTFKYDEEKDMFVKKEWYHNVTSDFVQDTIKECMPADMYNSVMNHPNANDKIVDRVFAIKDHNNMNILMVFEDLEMKNAMGELWTLDSCKFNRIIDPSFKEFFEHVSAQHFSNYLTADNIRLMFTTAISANHKELAGKNIDMKEVVNIISNDTYDKKEGKEHMNENDRIVAIQFGRNNPCGAMEQLSPACSVPNAWTIGIKPNTVSVVSQIFNDSPIVSTVYIARDLYDEFEKLLDKNDFLFRFENELVKLEADKSVDDVTMTVELSRVLRKVVVSLNDIIRVQALNGEKNAVLYLKNIKEKTEELIKSMEKNDIAEADEPIPVKEYSKPAEPKVEEYRKGKIDMINKHPYSKNMFKPQSILSKVYETGNRIKNDRNISGIFMQAVSEIGELGEEVRIKTDKSYYRKDEGKDGILGEACDTIIALTDLLNIAGYTLEDIDRVITSKLNKWESKVNDNKIMVNIAKCDGDVGNFDYVKMYNDVNGKESRVCYIGLNTFLVINYEDGKILGSTVYEGFDKFVEFVKNCNIGDIDNPNMLAKEIVDMLDRKGE